MYCLTELYDGREMYRIYYIKNNYMFRPFTLAIIRLRNEKNCTLYIYKLSVHVHIILYKHKMIL